MLKSVLASGLSLALVGLLAGPVASYGQDKKSSGDTRGDKPAPRAQQDAKKFMNNFFEKYDKNKDGAVSRDELPKSMHKGFDRMDTNKDGKLSRDELRQHAARMWRQGPVEVVTIWVFAAERNAVDREDLQQAYDALRKLDADNDGKITDQEIREGRKEMMRRRLDSFIGRYDSDGDGKISKEEAEAGPVGQAFGRLDSNGDGHIDRSELERASTGEQKGDRAGGKGKAREGDRRKKPDDR